MSTATEPETYASHLPGLAWKHVRRTYYTAVFNDGYRMTKCSDEAIGYSDGYYIAAFNATSLLPHWGDTWVVAIEDKQERMVRELVSA